MDNFFKSKLFYFIFLISLLFFYLLKYTIDRIEINGTLKLVIPSLGLGIILGVLFFIGYKNKSFKIVSIVGAFPIALVVLLASFLPRHESELRLNGTFTSKDADGDNIELIFLNDDSVQINFPPEIGRATKYKIENGKIKIYDEGKIIFDWSIVLESNMLKLSHKQDNFILYRNAE